MTTSPLLALIQTVATERARVAAIPRRGIPTPAPSTGALDSTTGLGSPGMILESALEPPEFTTMGGTVYTPVSATLIIDFPADTTGRATTLGAPRPSDAATYNAYGVAE